VFRGVSDRLEVKKPREALVPLGVRVAPEEKGRVEAWKKRYAQLPAGLPQRILLLMGMAVADEIGGLDFSVLGESKSLEKRRKK